MLKVLFADKQGIVIKNEETGACVECIPQVFDYLPSKGDVVVEVVHPDGSITYSHVNNNAAARQTITNYNYCPNCGVKLPSNVHFCSNCGAEINVESPAEEYTSEWSTTKDMPKVKSNKPVNKQKSKTRKKSFGSMLLKAILTIFLLFGAYVVVMNVLNRLFPSGGTQATAPVAVSKHDVYEDEITYDQFLWGDSVTKVSEITGITYYEGGTPGWEEASNTVMPLASYSLGYNIYDPGDKQFEGYDIANLSMFFMYGIFNGEVKTAPEDSKLYLVTFNLDTLDVNGAYETLYEKFSAIYGTPVEYSDSNRIFSSDGTYDTFVTNAEWEGQNATGLRISKSLPEDSAPDSADSLNRYIVVSYGKNNSMATLSKIYNTIKDSYDK